MNKRKLLFIAAIILYAAVMFGLNEINSFDGYYRTVEGAVNHEREAVKGAEKIAFIENGSGYIYIMSLDDSIILYSFKSKNTLTGKKYAVLQKAVKTIDYDALSGSIPSIEDWNEFSKLIFNKPDEKDLYWYVVDASSDLSTLKSTVSQYEYTYNGNKYYVLCLSESE